MQYDYRASLAALFKRQTKRGRNSVNSYNSYWISYKNSINNADPCTFQIIWYLKHSTLKKNKRFNAFEINNAVSIQHSASTMGVYVK